MLVERIYINNDFRNFHYLIACPETGDALAIDPYDADILASTAAARGWKVRQILCTHHHWDHVEGKEALRKATGAVVLAHADAPLDGVDRGLHGGDIVAIGSSVRLAVLDTPGHTMSHVCLHGHGHLFSGDTLFIAGCGHCRDGGNLQALWETFSRIIWHLPDETRVQGGHDYAVRNLGFVLHHDPGNKAARAALAEAETIAAGGGFFDSTIGHERSYNLFFRTGAAEIRDALKVPENAPDKEVFMALREARNTW